MRFLAVNLCPSEYKFTQTALKIFLCSHVQLTPMQSQLETSLSHVRQLDCFFRKLTLPCLENTLGLNNNPQAELKIVLDLLDKQDQKSAFIGFEVWNYFKSC